MSDLIPESNSKVASVISAWLDRAKNEQGLTQSKIQRDLGLSHAANFLSLVKLGRAKLPLDRVKPLAQACGVEDISELVEAMLDEYHPGLAPLLVEAQQSTFDRQDADVVAAVLNAKKRAHNRVRQIRLQHASNRVEEQKAILSSASWNTTPEQLDKLEHYVFENMFHAAV